MDHIFKTVKNSSTGDIEISKEKVELENKGEQPIFWNDIEESEDNSES